jgi:hypothetical protein
MPKRSHRKPALVVVSVLLSAVAMRPAGGEGTSVAGDPEVPSKAAPRTHFLVVGKGLVADPPRKQEIAATAVGMMTDALGTPRDGLVVEALAEGVITKEQYRRGEAREKVTGAIFREHLEQLAATASPRDTVVIYTHGHGRRNGFEEAQPLGGLVMDLPVRRPEHRGTLLWDDYVDLILAIPARNVVVLTMSCFSGGLPEFLERPEVRKRWGNRSDEGRNFVVLTSQSKDLPSGPIMKDGEVVNPFTFAVARMLAGEADGFSAAGDAPPHSPDECLTIGEMIDHVLHTTRTVPSDNPRLKNSAQPQVTGSYDREARLSFGGREGGASTRARLE